MIGDGNSLLITNNKVKSNSENDLIKLTRVRLVLHDYLRENHIDSNSFGNFCELLSDILLVNVDNKITPFMNQGLLDMVVNKLNRK